MDELPTLYFHKIDRLIGTARSNKVSVTLGFQELPQLEADYGKVGMQKIITTVGNVVSLSLIHIFVMAAGMAYKMMVKHEPLDVLKLFRPLAVSIILCWWYPPADTRCV